MEAVFFIFFFLIFGFIVSIFYKIISNGIIEKRKNDKAPILQIPVVVVEKRVKTNTSTSMNDDNYNDSSTWHTYKITFEHLHTGIRHTFTMNESKFDKIIEDDIGYLTYQRKRYHSFQRDEGAAEFDNDASFRGDLQFKIEE